ncbi:MAG: molybdopterin-dependent oxidoreductase, partial [Chloroflexi bacterium]|nr:molybdopterin-dependent oxidoreductase [Chloroflexota bacterium]
RGLGNIQAAFAYESQMDQLAQKLGLDPLEFRLQNAYQLGSRTATGQVLEESVGVRATLEAIQPYWREAKKSAFGGAATSDGWVKRGAGIATAWRCYPIGYREAFTELREDGRIVVETGATEMGQGTFTIFAQMAADELKVPLESLVVVAGSNAHSAGSTTTQGHGNAIMDAVRNLKAVLLQAAADMLEEKVDNVRLENGFFSSVADSSLKIGLERLAAVARGRGIPLRQKGSWHSRMERKFDFTTGQGVLGQVYGYSSQLAEVEVNTQNGEIKVRRIVAAIDAGRVINPLNLEGQVEGSVVQGMGFALMEGFVPGQSRRFKDYRIPTLRDIPEIVCLLVEEPVPSGPYGAKGAGELAIAATPAAIMNAVANALGVRIFHLPATPERVLEALKGQPAQ